MRRIHLAALGVLLLPLAPSPEPPHHPPGFVSFRVRHFGFSWVVGTFDEWAANIEYNAEQPELGSVTAWIHAKSIGTGHAVRDADLREHYLAADEHPGIVFTSTRVERAGLERLRVTGDLTIGEITRPVVLDTEVRDVVRPEGQGKAFTATTTIYRQDFGIIQNNLFEWLDLVGDEVEITIEAQAGS